MLSDLLLIFISWIVLLAWQLVSFPIIFKLYANKAADAGWGFGRLVTWLLLSTTIWFLGHLSIPANQSLFIYFLFFLLSVWANFILRKNFSLIKQFFAKRWKLIVTQELIFLVFAEIILFNG